MNYHKWQPPLFIFLYLSTPTFSLKRGNSQKQFHFGDCENFVVHMTLSLLHWESTKAVVDPFVSAWVGESMVYPLPVIIGGFLPSTTEFPCFWRNYYYYILYSPLCRPGELWVDGNCAWANVRLLRRRIKYGRNLIQNVTLSRRSYVQFYSLLLKALHRSLCISLFRCKGGGSSLWTQLCI